MELYDISNQSVADDGSSTYDELITRVVTDIFSFDDLKRRRTIEHYYFPNASFTSPILRTQGSHNIKHVMLVWKAVNKEPPTVNNICFNGKTCIAFLTQTLCPRIFPWIKLSLPVTVILEFKETDKRSDLYKIQSHQEHWTIEGILKTVPCLAFWYDHILRTMIGKMLSVTGEAVYTASETASLLLSRSREIEEARKRFENAREIEVIMLKMKASSESLGSSSTTTCPRKEDGSKKEECHP